MAILDYNKNKMTPKQKAGDYLYHKVNEFLWEEYADSLGEYHDFTEREKELIGEQVQKYQERIFKLLGFEV
jgi:hypothetical protein